MTPDEREQLETARLLLAQAFRIIDRLVKERTESLRPGEQLSPKGNVIDKLEKTYRSSHRQLRHRKPALPSELT